MGSNIEQTKDVSNINDRIENGPDFGVVFGRLDYQLNKADNNDEKCGLPNFELYDDNGRPLDEYAPNHRQKEGTLSSGLTQSAQEREGNSVHAGEHEGAHSSLLKQLSEQVQNNSGHSGGGGGDASAALKEIAERLNGAESAGGGGAATELLKQFSERLNNTQSDGVTSPVSGLKQLSDSFNGSSAPSQGTKGLVLLGIEAAVKAIKN